MGRYPLGGPAVAALQRIFLTDWMFTTGRQVADGRYFPEVERSGDALAQIVASGPDCRWPTIQQLHFQAITAAADRAKAQKPATPTAARLARAYDEQLRRRKRLLDRMTAALRQHGPKLGGGWDEVEDLKHVNELLENATEFIESAI